MLTLTPTAAEAVRTLVAKVLDATVDGGGVRFLLFDRGTPAQ